MATGGTLHVPIVPGTTIGTTSLSDTDDDQNFEEMLKDLLIGQRVIVLIGEIPSGRPSWFDESKYEAGRRMAEKYYGGILFAHLVSLALFVYSPQVLKPLIFTGKSETPEKSYRRYLNTAVQVLCWYRDDMWRNGSAARRSLQQVRDYHSQLAVRANDPTIRPLVDKVDISCCGDALHRGRPLLDAIREDFEVLPDCPFAHLVDANYTMFERNSADPPVPYFNQLDMNGTQFTFVALILLFPEKFGMKRASEEELEGFIHLWRCLGWTLGIEDRYNFCRLDNLPDVRRWTRYVMNRMVLPLLKSSLSAEYEHIGRAVVLGANRYMKASYETLFLFVGWVLGIPMPNVEKRASPIQLMAVRRLTFLFGWLFNLPLANRLLNAFMSFTIKLIVDPPRFWPRRFRPPQIKGLKEYWNGW